MTTAIQPTTAPSIEARSILSISDAAQLLGCSRRFLELEAARGRLTVVRLSGRLIRVRRSDLDLYLSRHAVTAV
jgi:excisionase family DNA binding protein